MESMTRVGLTKDPRRPAGAVDGQLPEAMAPEHRALVLQGLEAVRRGDVLTEAEAEAFFARYRR